MEIQGTDGWTGGTQAVSFRGIAVWATLTALMSLGLDTSFAQSAPVYTEFSPPDVKVVDPAGVSLISGHAEFHIAPLSIGPKDNPLVFSERHDEGIFRSPANGMYGNVVGGNNWAAYQAGYVVVKVFGKSEVFVGDRVSSYQSWSQSGGILTVSNGIVVQYTDRDGIQYNFATLNPLSTCTNNLTSPGLTMVNTVNGNCAVLRSVTYPDGMTMTLTDLGVEPYAMQNRSFVRSDGFAIHADYATYPFNLSMTGTSAAITKLTGINLAVDYCDTTQVALNCSFSQTWPTATFQWNPLQLPFTAGATQTLQVTDDAGRVTTYTQGMGASLPQGTVYEAVMTVTAPSSSGAVTSDYNTAAIYTCTDGGSYWNCQTVREGLVESASTEDGTWSYTYINPGYPNIPIQDPNSQNWVSTSSRPDGYQATATYNTRTSYVSSVVTSAGSLFYNNSNPNRITTAVDSEGRTFGFLYDGRGNITQKQQMGSDGSAGPTWTAGFDATCVYPVKCNKPNWIKDPDGNETDYTYDPMHGGVLTETLPADVHGIRPQKRYTYAQRYSWLKNAAGGYSASAAPIWKRASVSQCNSGAWNGTACIGAAGQTLANDLVTTTYEYGPDAGPNNLLLRGVAVSSGGVTHRTCYGYDALGNKISETTPNAGLGVCP